MDTYIVTQDQIAILYREREAGDPFALVSACLREHGLPPWPQPKIELFIRGDRRLLLARPLPPVLRRVRKGEPRARRRTGGIGN